MPRRVTVHYVSLKSCLVNLPISMYGPLVGNGVRPQGLVVHLLKPGSSSGTPAKEAHVGWTGLASASSLAQLHSQTTSRGGTSSSGSLETVEMDPQLASALGFAQGDVLEIGLLHDLPIAKSIATEPLTADDWEILELHAGYVEDNLLTQVRAASVDQEIDVWILGRTRIRFRVVSTDPPTSSSKKAVLLSTNTEVSIAPKLRKTSALPTANTAAPLTNGHSKAKEAIKPLSSTSSPSTQTKKPLALRALPSKLVPPSLAFSGSNATPTAFVSPSTFARLVSSFSSGSPPSVSVTASIHILPAPNTKSIPVTGSEAAASASQSQSQPTPLAAAKSLLLNGATKVDPSSKEAGEGEGKVERVQVRKLRGVPERHVVILGQLERGSVGDWDVVSLRDVQFDPAPKREDDAVVAAPLHLVKQTSNTTLAGITPLLSQLTSFLIHSFALLGEPARAPQRSAESAGIPAVLLCGASGSGRTSVAKEVVRSVGGDGRVLAHHIYVDLAKLSEERVPVLKALFERWIDIASWHRPSVIVLDNLDSVVGAEAEHEDSSRQRHIAEHFIAAFSRSRGIRGVVLLATAQSASNLHPLVSSAHIFSERVMLKAPDKNARRDILTRLVEKHISSSDLEQDGEDPLNFVSIATQTEGYSATDLHDLVGRAVHQAAIRSVRSGSGSPSKMTLAAADFEAAQVDFTPLSLRNIKLQKTSDVQWADIGGLHETKRVLRETLEWPTKYSAIFARCPIRLRSGLLLYGYPGCGKTLLASAVAKECGLNFISVKGPELLNKYIGASEKSVRDLFDRATAAKPCVLFFDEFDSIAPKRGHDSTGVTDRVVNQLLTQMDGAEGLDGVYVLAATSRPDLIDSALLRPGRLDKSLLCNMPDETERAEILNALRRKVTLSSSISVEEYARNTEGYSGADLQALVYNAHLDAVHASITAAEAEHESAKTSSGDGGEDTPAYEYTTFGGKVDGSVLSRAEKAVQERRLETIMESLKINKASKADKEVKARPKPIVDAEHLRNAMQSTRPSVSTEEQRRLSRIYAAFVSDRSGEMQVPPDAGGIGARASLG